MGTRLRKIVPDQELIKFYEQMFVPREFEERCAAQYTKGQITGFLNLYNSFLVPSSPVISIKA